MRFWFQNTPVMLPADWQWRIEPGSKAGEYRVRIEPPKGKAIDLAQALTRCAIETTSSRPELRVPVPTLE